MTKDVTDFVVVGSGAAGATAALVLAEAGHEVVVLEEGPAVRDEDRGLGSSEAFMRLFRDKGTQVAMGRSVIPILQGRCVGGTTVVNGAIVWRVPEDAYDRCFKAPGAREHVPYATLLEKMDRIERDLEVAPTPEATLGRNGSLMKLGAERLGWAAHAIRRNVKDCRGSGRCLEACPTRQKRSMEVTYLPRAEKLGATVLADHEVLRIDTSGGTAVGVSGRTPEGPFRVAARKGVVLAASAIQSPCLLAGSGIGPRAHVGAHFHAHPGTAVSGVYRDPVRIWEGATQSYEVDHFRADGGFKLEVVGLPLELAGVRMQGLGEDFQRAMRDYGHMAVWGVQVRAEAEGRVSTRGGRTVIEYTPSLNDMARFREGVKRLCELHFAAGAVRVYPGVHDGPVVLTSMDELDLLDELPLDPRHWSLIAAHLFGTARMGATAAEGVVGWNGAAHDLHRLWVLDASVFPGNLGVNPQHTIMALAMHLAEGIA